MGFQVARCFRLIHLSAGPAWFVFCVGSEGEPSGSEFVSQVRVPGDASNPPRVCYCARLVRSSGSARRRYGRLVSVQMLCWFLQRSERPRQAGNHLPTVAVSVLVIVVKLLLCLARELCRILRLLLLAPPGIGDGGRHPVYEQVEECCRSLSFQSRSASLFAAQRHSLCHFKT